MELLSTVRSQINNVKNFRSLFNLPQVAASAATLPLDYVSPSAEAAHPVVINFLTASRCNLKCVMCTADKLMASKVKEMSPADYETVARQMAKYKPSCFFGGGEPFLRHDILDVIRAVKKYGLHMGMVTNGLMFTPERGAAVKQLGVESIMFSIHGTEEAHDHITGAKGSFRTATANIEAFCKGKGERKTRVMLNFVLQPENLDDVFNLVEKGKELGVDQVRVEHLLFMTPAEVAQHEAYVKEHAPELLNRHLEIATHFRDRPPPEGHTKKLSEVLVRLKAKYGDFVFIKPWLGEREVSEWYSEGYDDQKMCFFIWRSLFIDAQGNVIPCQSYPEMKFGNALREPLMEIWNSPHYREFRKTIRSQRLPGCARCCKS